MNADTENTSGGEVTLLESARGGDEDAFRRLVEPYRRELHAHCYRMLGSAHDADDALQDTLLRAWRGLGRFEGRSSLRSWLYRIATNACLDLIARRPKRVIPIDHGPADDGGGDLGEPVTETIWVEPYADQALEEGLAAPEARYELRESVELAFIAALQNLPGTQRAALILLGDVLGFSARETAEALETTVASVNGALQRGRKAASERLPSQSQQATLRALGDDGVREIVGRYIDAWERADVDAILALLAEDATFSMPPLSTWYRGHAAIRTFLARYPLQDRWRLPRPARTGTWRSAVTPGMRTRRPTRRSRSTCSRWTATGRRRWSRSSPRTRTAPPARDSRPTCSRVSACPSGSTDPRGRRPRPVALLPCGARRSPAWRCWRGRRRPGPKRVRPRRTRRSHASSPTTYRCSAARRGRRCAAIRATPPRARSEDATGAIGRGRFAPAAASSPPR